MIEYAATILIFTPLRGHWRGILTDMSDYIQANHAPYSPIADKGVLLTMETSSRRIISVPSFDITNDIPTESDGFELWCSLSVEVRFGGQTSYVYIRLRQVSDEQTFVQLWFPSRVYDGMFCYDQRHKEFDPDTKSDFMRLTIGLAKVLNADGFGFCYDEEDRLLEPVMTDVLREYVEIREAWVDPGLGLFAAGIAAPLVSDEMFKYDVEDHPRNYRQSGYYLYDNLWPVDY